MSYAVNDDSGLVVKYEYTLDERGYPQQVTGSGRILGDNSVKRYQYVYENCRQARRIAYNADGTENPNAEFHISYDGQGRIIRRTNASSDETFAYSCW